MINLESLLQFATPFYEQKDIMHNMTHIENVLKSVDRLIENGHYNVKKEILIYATYFHGFIYSSEDQINAYLTTQRVSKEDIQNIIKVAWESQKDEPAETIEGKLLHDAHMIEGGENLFNCKIFNYWLGSRTNFSPDHRLH